MRGLRIYAAPDIFAMSILQWRRCRYFPTKRRSNFRPLSGLANSLRPYSRGGREASWHVPPGRVLAVWLDGVVEFETRDGEMRRVPVGGFVPVQDTRGKGHVSCPSDGGAEPHNDYEEAA
jgi:hypothetical protein